MKLSVVAIFFAGFTVAFAHTSHTHHASHQSVGKSHLGNLWHHIKLMATHPGKVIKNTYHKLCSNDKCHGLECPSFTVKKKTDDYELRCYPAYTWVGTSYTGE